MSNLNLTSLSHEILENIFGYLNLEEIKIVTLVCKQFNEVVGNSKPLMKKMKLSISSGIDGDYENIDDYQLVRSNRKYSEVNIDSNIINEVVRMFLPKQTNLTELFFDNCHLTASEFCFTLNCVNQTLTELIFIDSAMNTDCAITPIEFPKLKNLVFDSSYDYEFERLFKCFYGARNIEELDCHVNNEIKTVGIVSFWRIATSMVNLKKMIVFNAIFRNFQTDLFLATQIKLESLDIFGEFSSKKIIGNFAKFLDMQGSTLKNFCWSDAKISPRILESILNMTALNQIELKWLKTHSSNDQNKITYNTNSSIEDIYLLAYESVKNDESLIQDLFVNCIRLKKLKLFCNEISFDMLCTLAYHVKNLESLTLDFCKFIPITMPKIKMMTLKCDNDSIENIIRMIRLNRQLKKLKLDKSLQNNFRCISAIQEINVADVEFI